MEKVFPPHAPAFSRGSRHGIFTARSPLGRLCVLVVILQSPLEQSAVFTHGVRRLARVPRERHRDDALAMPSQRRRHVPFDVIGRVHPRGEIFAPDDHPSAIRAPCHARRIVVHPAVGSEETERGELLEHRRGGPDLNSAAHAHRERTTARAEFARGHLSLEVHVMKHHAFPGWGVDPGGKRRKEMAPVSRSCGDGSMVFFCILQVLWGCMTVCRVVGGTGTG